MSATKCDVVVAGAGLVGLSLAYELACLGGSVTVVDAAHRGRATAAGAGILSPATSPEEDAVMWPFLQGAGSHYRSLLARLEADGVPVEDAAYRACGVLSLCLRANEDRWFAPFAEMALRRSPGAISEISAGDARDLFPPLGPIHRVLHAPGSARVDGRAMAAALRAGATVRGVEFVDGVVHGVVAAGSSGAPGGAGGGAGTRHVESVCVEGHHNLDCGALVVAGGAWTAAMGEWLGCALPVGPTKGQIVHLGVEADTGSWPIVQPLLTHYLVPWPDGRVACGGTFETAAGYSVTATAGGLHELLRECLTVAPGLEGARYLETRVGLRPTSPDDRAVVGRVPSWDNAWVATGHGANGLLQGPYSARVVAHAVTGSALPPDEPPLPPSFDPARFV